MARSRRRRATRAPPGPSAGCWRPSTPIGPGGGWSPASGRFVPGPRGRARETAASGGRGDPEREGRAQPRKPEVTCTNTSRICDSASRRVGSASPSRPARPSTSAPIPSMARAAAGRVRRILAQVDRGQLVQAHHVVGDHDLRWHLRQLAADLVDLGPHLGLGRGSSGRSSSRSSARSSERSAPGCASGSGSTGCSPPGVQRLLTCVTLTGQLNSESGPCCLVMSTVQRPTRPPDPSDLINGAPWSTEVLPGTLAISCVASGGLPVRRRRAFSSALFATREDIPCHGVSSNSHAGDQRAPDQRPHPSPRGPTRRTRRRAARHQAAARGTRTSPVSSISTSSRLRRQANPPVCRGHGLRQVQVRGGPAGQGVTAQEHATSPSRR